MPPAELVSATIFVLTVLLPLMLVVGTFVITAVVYLTWHAIARTGRENSITA